MTNAGRSKANLDRFGKMVVDILHDRELCAYFGMIFSELYLYKNIFVKSVTRAKGTAEVLECREVLIIIRNVRNVRNVTRHTTLAEQSWWQTAMGPKCPG